MATTYRVSGMTCGGCAQSVERAIKAVAPDAKVKVDLPGGKVTVDSSSGETVSARAVADAGCTYGGVA
ncbi:MAG: heavy-metal-associated domain-containing protein [Alphaproteobacteria bacterium]|nr:heavy-metal-associated domain-containing protein [Alphaproteobacteria bacterium]